jgi:hypothetical protein
MRPRPPPDPHRLVGPLWIAEQVVPNLQARVEQLIDDISPEGHMRYQQVSPPPPWWDRFDTLWTEWLSLAQSELYRNQGFTHPVGQVPQFTPATPKTLVRVFKRSPHERPWKTHLRRLQEAHAAILADVSPPGYHRDWPRWTKDRVRHLHSRSCRLPVTSLRIGFSRTLPHSKVGR